MSASLLKKDKVITSFVTYVSKDANDFLDKITSLMISFFIRKNRSGDDAKLLLLEKLLYHNSDFKTSIILEIVTNAVNVNFPNYLNHKNPNTLYDNINNKLKIEIKVELLKALYDHLKEFGIVSVSGEKMLDFLQAGTNGYWIKYEAFNDLGGDEHPDYIAINAEHNNNTDPEQPSNVNGLPSPYSIQGKAIFYAIYEQKTGGSYCIVPFSTEPIKRWKHFIT